MQSPVDVSYLADAVVLTRFFEVDGFVRKAISVMKKRAGRPEMTIRELDITGAGIRLSEPLHGFRGILTGIPEYDPAGRLRKDGERDAGA
jgi:circadian clock protein KaiC